MNIQDFQDKHKGQTCFILGNGPSLNNVDVASLPDYPMFGSNRIYLKDDARITYYSCVNPLVLNQYRSEIEAFDAIKFLNEPYATELDAVAIDTRLGIPVFNPANLPMWEGHTVTYVLLQLAYYMGFTQAILLGLDHDYGDKAIRPNLELVATGPDLYHFDPTYFSNNVRWNAPDLQQSELAYRIAKLHWEGTGRRIINASAKTKLDVFEILPLRHLFDPTPRSISALVSAYKCPPSWLDGTIEDIRRSAEKDVEIVVVCQEDSGFDEVLPKADKVVWTRDIPTVYHAWNLAAKAASGKYLTNCNTDDRRHPLSIRLLADILDASPEIDVAYHDQFVTWGEPITWFEFFSKYGDERLLPGRVEGKPGMFAWQDHNLAALGQGCYLGPQPMWRANLHQRYGWFIDNYKSAGDYEFWLRVAKHDNFFRIPFPLGVYCARLDGVELENPVKSLEESQLALMINQDPDGVQYIPEGRFIRIEIGGHRVYTDPTSFFDTARKIEARYAPV